MTRIRPKAKAISKPFLLVPVVDVFFLLLVPFMISSSVTFWPGEKVETEVLLPKVRVGELSVADKLIVTMTNSGDLFFNSKPMASVEELERELRKLLREEAAGDDAPPGTSRRPMLALRADYRNTYGQIVKITALARELGLDICHMLDPGSAAPGTKPVLDNDE